MSIVSESRRQAKVLRSSASSAARILKEQAEVAGSLAESGTRDRLKQVVRPNSLSRTLRRTGVALIMAPEPFTGVAGVVMLGASFAAKGRQPLSSASVYEEAGELLAEIDSFI